MQVRADGLIRSHRDHADQRCAGGGQPPQPHPEPLSLTPTRDELRSSILTRLGVFTTRVDWIGGSTDIAFADSVIALAEWLSDVWNERPAA